MNTIQGISLQDLFITPIVLSILFGIVFFMRSRVKDPVIRPYFIPAFGAKVIGSIALGLIYQFYYGGGDTFNFFRESSIVWQAFLDSPSIAFTIIFSDVNNYSPELYEYVSQMYFFDNGDGATFNVIRLVSFLGFFTFHTYTSIAVIFAFLSFTGMWAMYRVFYDLYPQIHRPLALAIFFVPSIFFWGSGILKDTISLGALGWVFYGFYFGVIKWERIGVNFSILLAATLVIQSIKVYIIAAFMPGLLLWLFIRYRNRIKSSAVRFIALPFLVAISLPLGFLSYVQLTRDNQRYQLENLAATAQTTSSWLATVSERQGGSGYSLGNVDYSLTGIILVFPRALWLGLFQPHPWEAGFNPVMLLSALEASFFLYITLRILFTSNLFRLYRLFFEHPVLIFCLGFSTIFAVAMALTSYNFGTLVRYRIPMMPFYLSMLYIIRFQLNNSRKLI